MMRKLQILRWLGLMFMAVLAGCHPPHSGREILEQRPVDPILGSKLRARVLIFVSNDCPVANRYAPEIRRLHERYAPQGVAFWLVHSDPEETLANVQEHDRQYGLSLPVILDPDHSVARLAKAEVVPTAAIFSSSGEMLYRGRIDDRFAELGRERSQPARHDLQEVLDDIVAGRPVAFRQTKAVGCYIPNSP